MEIFYYTRAGRGRRSLYSPVRRTPAPMAGETFADPCRLSSALQRRAAPIVAQLEEAGFEAPAWSLAENELAMEPDCLIAMRHEAGYTVALIELRWGARAECSFLSLFRKDGHEERLVTASRRLPRRALPASTCQSPWTLFRPGDDPGALWEWHQRVIAQRRGAVLMPLPTGEELLHFCDTYRLDLFRRRLALGLERPLRGKPLEEARRRMATARDYAQRMSAMGGRHALLFTRLHEQIAREERRQVWRLHGAAVVLAVAGVMMLLGSDPVVFGWAAAGAGLHLVARGLVRRRYGSSPGGSLAVALAGPLALGLAGGLLAWGNSPPPVPALLYALSALILLLPLPGLDGGEVVERLLYHRLPWLKPLLYITAGGLLGLWAWRAEAFFGLWIAGLMVLAPLLDPQRPRLARQLRRKIDWSRGATPEAVAALLAALERPGKAAFSEAQIVQLYREIRTRPPRPRASAIALSLYLCAFTLPFLPASRWLMQAPALSRIASAAPPADGLLRSTPTFIPARWEWSTVEPSD